MIRTDDRAVSSALSYALVIVITVSLTAGLVIGADSFINQQREQAALDQLEVVGQRLASTIMTVDRESANGRVAVTQEFPKRVAGAQYLVRIERDGAPDRGTVFLEARDLGVSVAVPVKTSGGTSLLSSPPPSPTLRRNGGPLRIVYDPATDSVVVEDV